jgi:hypothetical protein
MPTIKSLFDGLPPAMEKCPPRDDAYRKAQGEAVKCREQLLETTHPEDKDQFTACLDRYWEAELLRENLGSAHYFEMGFCLGAMLMKEILEGGGNLLEKLE